VISNTNTGITKKKKVGSKFNDQETFVILLFCTLFAFQLLRKLQPTELGKTKVDSLYREDQFI
jgi:hypothetical protein